MKKILIVDDEKPISDIIKFNMTKEGYEVVTAFNGREAIELFEAEQPDIIILDLMLPEIDGLEVAKTIRKTSSVPIIMLSAKDSEFDKVIGLELGADDYVTKPFSNRELQARVKALLRRVEMERGGDPTDRDITVGDLRFSGDEKQLFCREKPLALSPNELKMLLFLMRGEGKAFSRDELLTHIWGYNDEVETRVTDETLRRIRSKLSSADSKVQIETVWGYGYRLRSDGGGK